MPIRFPTELRHLCLGTICVKQKPFHLSVDLSLCPLFLELNTPYEGHICIAMSVTKLIFIITMHFKNTKQVFRPQTSKNDSKSNCRPISTPLMQPSLDQVINEHISSSTPGESKL